MMGRKKVVSTIGALAIGALILTGCASTEPPTPAPIESVAATPAPPAALSAQPAPKAIEVDFPSTKALMKLPWVSTYEVYGKVASADPGTPFLGLVASLPASEDYIVAYKSAGGKAFALIGPRQLSDATALPVIGQRDGWVQVLIPGRRNLPSSGKPVSGATAWIPEADILLAKQTEEVVVDLTAGTVKIFSAGKVVKTHKVVMDGKDLSASGVRGFAVSTYWNEAQKACSSEKLLAVSVQSEKYDAFADGVSIQAIHGWSKECRAVSAQTARTSGCINLSDASMKDLLSRIKPGAPVTFKS